jgi:hypothetical protein
MKQKNTSMNTTDRNDVGGGRSGAFTLVELMISIALVLLLVLGINAIFRTTADTISGGQAAITNARALRNAYDVMNADFTGFMSAGSQPVLLIYNQNLPAFRDKADEGSDLDYPTAAGTVTAFENMLHEFNGTSNAPQPNWPPRFGNTGGQNGMSLLANNRNHRIDILSFCSTGRFRRQTGIQSTRLQSPPPNGVAYQSSYSSDTAYVWYGHGRQPASSVNTADDWLNPSAQNNANSFMPPGAIPVTGSVRAPVVAGNPQTSATNPNNFYARQWTLVRMAHLLAKTQPPTAPASPPAGGPKAAVIPASPPYEGYLDAFDFAVDPTQAGNEWAWLSSPFGFGNRVTYAGPGSPYAQRPDATLYHVQDSQCDMAGMGADDFQTRAQLAALAGRNNTYVPTGNGWYLPLLSTMPAPGQQPNSALENTLRYAAKSWVTRAHINGNTMSPIEAADEMALNSSSFIHGCSQFIVEFAGDYLSQDVTNPSDPNTYGKITGEASDGTLDFEIVPGGGNTPQKRIRWYGLPRSYSDNGTTTPDVQPVIAVLGQGLGNSAIRLPFEHIGYANNAKLDGSAFPQVRPGNSPAFRSYVCAWSPLDLQFPSTKDTAAVLNMMVPTPSGSKPMQQAYPNGFMPWMIRITIRVDDPNGRLPDGQTIQYVFTLPHK